MKLRKKTSIRTKTYKWRQKVKTKAKKTKKRKRILQITSLRKMSTVTPLTNQ